MKEMVNTPHYDAYASFKTKRSIDKKNRAKEKSLGKKTSFDDSFVIKESKDFGIVIEVRYDDAYVLYDDDIVLAKLRNDINMVCNQAIFPGDKVVLNKLNDEYIIQNLISRISILSRVKKDSTRLDDSVGLMKNTAANINLAVIVVSAKEPPLHPKFIDRYLMILKNSEIAAVICLNKSDLKTDEEEKILDIYRKIDIPVVETSTYQKEGIEELKGYLKGKQAIFVGNSGVGKSSLTNAIMDDDEIKTSHVSEKSKRGRHTTTTSKYYIWDDNSSIIDTPGIRSLDVSSFKPIEIQDYFSEFDSWKEKCRYKDCLHFNEPCDSCLVKQGVASGIINKSRYESYIRIVSSLMNEKKQEDFMEEFKSYEQDNQDSDEKKRAND
jgi:ribosome biogenesis GTPase